MSIKLRPEPKIPDHEVLRKIGGGAFGEIWMARGVTGAWRGVKVVWREDYEDNREFDREFEGLLKYEPISRTSEGLVDVLHVGRSEDDSFYYYVMELADDCHDGQNINPVEYQPRTIHSDLADANGSPINITRCIEIAISLTEGLKALHDKGLAHRDIKPANVIFVNGKAKLADIGLVATRGQRTFVGTEGFVPPEGPGTAQADLYGLGKVLYEISTGKDRLQFPEAPEELPDNKKELKAWRELNKVICDVCEHNPSKRRLKNAALLLRELQSISQGHIASNVGFLASLKVMALGSASIAVITLGLWFIGYELKWWPFGPDQALELFSSDEKALSYTPPPKVSRFRVNSSPEGANVYLLGEAYATKTGEITKRFLGITPLESDATSGSVVSVSIELPNYRAIVSKGVVPANQPLTIFEQLEPFTPPEKDEAWQDSRGRKYVPDSDTHISINHVASHDWKLFIEWTYHLDTDFIARNSIISENGVEQESIFVDDPGMYYYCEWLTNESRDGGFLSKDQIIVAEPNTTIDPISVEIDNRSIELRPFRCRVVSVQPVTVNFKTNPPGARITINGQILNQETPFTQTNIVPRDYQILATKRGFKPATITYRFENGETYEIVLHLEKSGEVEFGQKWENSLGMRLVPVGESLLVSEWETRVKDYKAALNSGSVKRVTGTKFPQKGNHPITNVSREDAMAFCEWLTARERSLQKIGDHHIYRLPTDQEWSLFAGLKEGKQITPVQRERIQNSDFPWGEVWPPMSGDEPLANIADASSITELAIDAGKSVEGYDDGFPYTSPVGSFPANKYGIHDLGGNVREWVSDDYDDLRKFGVLRGGCWASSKENNLFSKYRYAAPPFVNDITYGFRVVLAPSDRSGHYTRPIDESTEQE